MDNKQQEKWYFKKSSLVALLLLLGPLALPLIWLNPRFSRTIKVITTIAVVILTYYLAIAFKKSLEFFNQSLQLLQAQ